MKQLDPLRVPLFGRVLVEASAGTGKTFAITTLYVRLVIERELDVGSILVVTYTRAATAELRERVRARLSVALALLDGASAEDADLAALLAARASAEQRALDRARLVAALRDFDQAAIFTIHAFCQRVLSDHALDTRLPFRLRFAENDDALVRELTQDFWSLRMFSTTPETIEALETAKVDLKALERLARNTLRDDGTRILPEKLPKPREVLLCLERFRAARRKAAELFREHRVELLFALRGEHAAIERPRYQIKQIDSKWTPELDALAKIKPALNDWLDRLTRAELRKYVKSARFPIDHPFFAAVDELVRTAKDAETSGAAVAVHVRRGLIDHARTALAERHRERGELGFDDLLQHLARVLESDGGDALVAALTQRYPAALIDEFQDTDPVQYQIVSRIFGAEGSLMCTIGDPKQAIYGFRGADVFAYVHAASKAAAASFTLEINRRSDRSLVNGVHTLFARAPRPFVLDSIGLPPVRAADYRSDQLRGDDEHALQLLFGPDIRSMQDLPRFVAGEITAVLNGPLHIGDRPVAPEDIAVLCRTNKQAREVQNELARLRVPSVLDGDRSVFESDTAKDLGRALTAIVAPTDGRTLAAALLGPLFGVDVAELLALASGDDGFEPWVERLSRLHDLWQARSFVRMFQTLLDEAHVQQHLLRRSDGERRLTDLLHLGELLHDVSVRERLGPEALLSWLRQQLYERDFAFAPEATQLRLEHDERALRLTTIHRSKGLEFPIVFCPFASSPGFPTPTVAWFHDSKAGDRRSLDLGGEDIAQHLVQAAREELSESTRLLYVALTRAKHRCYVVLSPSDRRDKSVSPLVYVLYQRAGITEPAEVASRYARLSEGQRREELDELAKASQGAIGVRELATSEPESYRPPPSAVTALAPHVAKRALSDAARATSFSRLVAALEHSRTFDESSAPDDEGRDVDALAVESLALSPPARPRDEPAKVLLHDFPAGTGPGTLIHAIYEHLDFTQTDPALMRAVVEQQLARYRFSTTVDTAVLVEAIADTLRTPLDASGELRLCRVGKRDRRDEVELTLSTVHAKHQLSAQALAAALERTSALPACPSYYARLAALPQVVAAEYVKGFMDLVFRCDGRYYVADYKSNLLGPHAADYAQPHVLAAMSEHHYFLQGYLYALALHRHLQQKLDGYSHAQHFGGIAYLFVRGMSEAHPRGTGVWLDRPSQETLEALAQALGARESAA